MALTSPGVEIDVINESFYVPAGTGSTPLIIVTSAQDKQNGSGTGIAPGTQSANAGTAYLVTSQRDLTTTFGTPTFYTDSGNNPLNGYELNEYGLQAAYSFLGVANQAYILRANIDLSQLTGSALEPTSPVANGTYWFDLSSTQWGIKEWNQSTQSFTNITPTIITDVNQLVGGVSTGAPLSGIGASGNYAINTTSVRNSLYRKNTAGVWHQVGSADWKNDIAAQYSDSSSKVFLYQSYNFQRPLFETNELNASTGSVWVLQNTANGYSPSIKLYNESTGTWVQQTVQKHGSEPYTLAFEMQAGTLSVGAIAAGYNTDQIGVAETQFFRFEGGATTITSANTTPSFTSTQSITVRESLDNNTQWSSPVTVTITGTDANAFATAFNSAGFQNLLATVTASGAISITHNGGGSFEMGDLSGGTVLNNAGLGTANASNYGGYNSSKITNLYLAPAGDQTGGFSVIASNWKRLSYVASYSAPTNEAIDGTLWYNTNLEADIMVRGSAGWQGYRSVYPATDPNGPQFSATAPTTQSGGASLVNNDLWIDTSDLENYPMINVYNTANGGSWTLLDNTDQTTQNGVVFADARWSGAGDDVQPDTIKNLLTYDYTDPDAPNYQVYPQGILLFNLRRSGNNVKKMNRNYITTAKYGAGVSGYNPDRWVSVSANQSTGAGTFGRKAVRSVIVAQLKSEIDTNQAIREDQRGFNIIACPGYPEAIANMLNLNVDRKDTAFVIGDSPLRLAANATAITKWANNSAGATDNSEAGLVSSDDYLGIFYPAGRTTDNSGNAIVVPASHMILRVFANNDNVAYPWFAPAGTRRGIVDNATAVGYIDAQSGEFQQVSLSEGIRDAMFTAQINPITFFSGVGLLNYGNQTKTSISSALDRINVARLVVYLRTQLDILAKPFIFEPNDTLTRNEISNTIQSFLLELVGQRALYDFLVVCDTTNNTPTTIDQNELYVDIAISPVKSVEFIYIPLRIYNTGAIATLGNK